MKLEEIVYQAGNASCKGYLAVEASVANKKRPAVMIAHTWRGRDEFVKEKARELARLGYVGFAADLFGDGRIAKDDAEAGSLIRPLFMDRKQLRERIVAAYNTIQSHPDVDPTQIAAIGFCFGGLVVIELLRSGVDIKGVASFHGVLGDTLGGIKAKREPSNQLKGAVLLLHGYQDPLVSPEDLVAIQKEFSEANIDWQLHIYGRAAHAFTNPQAHDSNAGLIYNEDAAKRSWRSMKHFLEEYLSIGDL